MVEPNRTAALDVYYAPSTTVTMSKIDGYRYQLVFALNNVSIAAGKTYPSTSSQISVRLRYTDSFDDPNLPGEMRTSVTLKKVSVGTDVSIVQEGVPDVIPAEACYLGWQDSLVLLGKLVEAEIPD